MLAHVKNFNLEKDLIFNYILLFSNISFKKFIIISKEPKTLVFQYLLNHKSDIKPTPNISKKKNICNKKN